MPVQPEMKTKSGKLITKRSRCKTQLYSLRTELDKEIFDEKMREFKKLLNGDKDYGKFGDYFAKTYENRFEQWAYAYLPASGVCNTNMYLEAWHKEFKHSYLDGVTQKRLDFVLHKLVEFDKDEQEEETRRKIFGRRRNKRSAKVLKCHKLAAEEKAQSKHKIKFVEKDQLDGNEVARFIFENEKVPISVVQVSDDPTHKCIYTCSECKTCIHRFVCSCEERRVRRNYCVHLCAVGLDKKLQFNFDDQDELENNEATAFNIGDQECIDSCEQFGNFDGYETDDAPEIENIIEHSEQEEPFEQVSAVDKTISLEMLTNRWKNIHINLIHAITEQPSRTDELFGELIKFEKRLKLVISSNINEISEFETERVTKRVLEKQQRRSPKKKKRRNN